METRTLQKIDFFVLGYGVAISIAAIIFFDFGVFVGTAVGAVVATANWLGFRWAGIRMAATGQKSRFVIFLGVKTALILGIVTVILTRTSVAPIPFMIGLSSLVLGVLTKSAIQALAEGDNALREER